MPHCPYCNQSMPSPEKTRHIHRFQSSLFASVGKPSGFTEAYRRTPARDADFTADVLVPALQALITAIISSLITLLGVGLFAWSWWSVPGVGLLVFGLAWLILLSDHRALLWSVESIINEDLDGDGHTGKPAALPAPRNPNSEPVRIQAEVREGQRWLFADFPAPSNEAMYQFAQAVNDGRATFSERSASQHGFSREQWQALRDEFLAARLAKWNSPGSPRQGVALTNAGAGLIRKISATSPEVEGGTQNTHL